MSVFNVQKLPPQLVLFFPPLFFFQSFDSDFLYVDYFQRDLPLSFMFLMLSIYLVIFGCVWS